ncbi:MAG: LytTR family DNA-binding domain-containing protein [Cyanobacteria bacterium J06600_6]
MFANPIYTQVTTDDIKELLKENRFDTYLEQHLDSQDEISDQLLDSIYLYIQEQYHLNNIEDALKAADIVVPFVNEEEIYRYVLFLQMRLAVIAKGDTPTLAEADVKILHQLENKPFPDSVLATIHKSLSSYYYRVKDYEEALYHYAIGIDNYLSCGHYEMAVKELTMKALTHRRVGDMELGLNHYFIADSLIEIHFPVDSDQERYERLKTRVYNGIGIVFMKRLMFEQSNKYFEQILTFKTISNSYRAIVQGNICGNNLYLENHSEVSRHCSEVLRLTNIRIHERMTASSQLIKSYCVRSLIDSAKQYLDTLEVIAGDPTDRYHCTYLLRKADVYQLMKKYKTSSATFKDAYLCMLDNEPGKLNSIRVALEGVIKSELLDNNDKSILDYFDLLRSQVDTINKIYHQDEILAAIKKYETELTLKKNELLQQRLENQKTQSRLKIGVLIILASLLGAFGWFSFKGYRLTLEDKKRLIFEKTELDQLNLKLNKQNEQLTMTNQELGDENETLIAQIEKKPEQISVKVLDKLRFILVNDISHIRAEDNGVRVFLHPQDSLWVYERLKGIHSRIKSNDLVRIHRGVLVNFEFIRSITSSTVILKNGIELPIGDAYRKNITDRLS